MKCPDCCGTGYSADLLAVWDGDLTCTYPCPECGGTGFAHCRDRLQARPVPINPIPEREMGLAPEQPWPYRQYTYPNVGVVETHLPTRRR